MTTALETSTASLRPDVGSFPIDPESSPAWEAPIPLSEICSAGPFPTDVLPPVLAGFVEEMSATLGCPADCVGPVLLALAGSAIGASRVLQLKDHCRERPALYLAVILPPGASLLPILQILAEPIYNVQASWLGLRPRSSEDIQQQLDDWLKTCSQSDPLEETEEDESLALGQEQWGKLRRWFATDATASALAVLLKDNPRGLLILRDDLAPWLSALQSKDGLHERNFYSAGWSGAPLCLDRRSPGLARHRPLMIVNPFLTLIGACSADRLAAWRENQLSSGVLDRFLFAFPDPWPTARWSPQTIAEHGRLAWESILDDLRALMPQRKTQPRLTRLSPSARRRWTEFFDSISQTANAPDSAGHSLSFHTHLQSYGARLALILHFLWWTAENLPADASDNAERSPGDSEPPDRIGAQAVERAARLVDYFLAHARKARSSMDARPKLIGARALWSWIDRARLCQFSRRDAHVALRGRFKTIDDLEPALNILLHHGYLRPVLSRPQIGPGRPSGPIFHVNPLARTTPDP